MSLIKPSDVEKMKTSRDVKGLINALKFPPDSIRQAAVMALSEIGAPAVEPLLDTLKDGNKEARYAAAQALGKIGDSRARKPLVVALKDENRYVRQMAAEALAQLGWKPRKNENGARYWIAREKLIKCVAIGLPAIAPLVAALKDDNWIVRKTAAEALVEIGVHAVEPLMAALADREACKAAAEALGKIGDDRAVKPLVAALQEENNKVRQTVAEALEQLGWNPDRDEHGARYWLARKEWDKCVAIGVPAVESLIAALKNSDREVRRSAASALGQIGDTRAVEPLIGRLREEKCKGTEVLEQIYIAWEVKPLIIALGTIGDARAVEPLVATLKGGNDEVREAAAEALGQIGVRLEDAALRARALESLEPALSDRSDEVRQAAAEALGQLGWNPGQDENGARYWIARGELARGIALGVPAIEPLVTVLKNRHETAYEVALQALVKLGAPAVEPLVAALQDERGNVREAAAEALGKIGDVRAVKPLLAALQDERGPVRRAAARALVELYHSDILDSELKRAVMSQRDTMQQHRDYEHHQDCDDFTYHIDHQDTGIGVKFPL